MRIVNSAGGTSNTNATDDRHLVEAMRRAERRERMLRQTPTPIRGEGPFIEPYLHPKIWFDDTYAQDAAARAETMHRLVQPAIKAGMLAAGYLQVSATGRSTMDGDRVWYYPYTWAQYSVTVRDPDGTGSGWAGVDWNDWKKIDTDHLSQVAQDKCLRSRNPVALEPGRYTTILEPQAVGDFIHLLFSPTWFDRVYAEFGDPLRAFSPYAKPDSNSPFNARHGFSKIGESVIDARLSLSTDPMDPMLGFPPFEGWQVYHPVTWIRDGVLKELPYYRDYAVKKLGKNTGGIPLFGNKYSGAFHMTVRGETATIDEMIQTTKRGVFVTRFSDVVSNPIDPKSFLLAGFTRDGTWLIENGKITKAIKNFRFTESPFFALNNVEQIGEPQRIFHPGIPIVVPALKVRDFSFTSLSDAI
jgi:predicted Zn-dependent protease